MSRFFNSTSESGGFTLIELVLYISIFSLIIGAIAGLTIGASSERVQNQAAVDVNYQGEAVMFEIVQAINNASSINSPTISNSNSTMSLSTASAGTNPTIFNIFTDSSTVRLQINEGSPSTQNYLTNSRVLVSNLLFTNVGASGSKGSILIQFTLSSLTASSRREFNFSKTFYGAASIR
jgi:type II secretory pathway pseudopilin PulG